MAQDNAYPGAWPRLMRAECAAAYVGERSADAFRRAVGTLYPQPIKVSGKGERWLKEALDQAIDRLKSPPQRVRDIADQL
jgi:predicted DNA-binding transcriptional regulator AlpA